MYLVPSNEVDLGRKGPKEGGGEGRGEGRDLDIFIMEEFLQCIFLVRNDCIFNR